MAVPTKPPNWPSAVKRGVAVSRTQRHCAVGAAQTVLGLEGRAGRGGGVVDRDESRHEVVGVDAVPGALSELLLERAPGEIDPGLVEVGRHALGVVHPDHDGRGVGDQAEPLFAFAQGLLAAAALRDVADDADDSHDFAGGVAVRAERAHDPARPARPLDREEEVPGGDRFAGEGAAEQLVSDPPGVRGHVEGASAERAVGRDPGQLLHVSVPDDAAQRPVVDDDSLARARDDLVAELIGLLELLARPAALGDVLDEALVVE